MGCARVNGSSCCGQISLPQQVQPTDHEGWSNHCNESPISRSGTQRRRLPDEASHDGRVRPQGSDVSQENETFQGFKATAIGRQKEKIHAEAGSTPAEFRQLMRQSVRAEVLPLAVVAVENTRRFAAARLKSMNCEDRFDL